MCTGFLLESHKLNYIFPKEHGYNLKLLILPNLTTNKAQTEQTIHMIQLKYYNDLKLENVAVSPA